MALAALTLAAFTVVPGLVFMDVALTGQRAGALALHEEFTADSAVTEIMWAMKYYKGPYPPSNDTYAINGGACGAPPCAVPVTLNGIPITTWLYPRKTSALVEQTFSFTPNQSSNYNPGTGVAAGHQLWVELILEGAASLPDIYLGYDTEDYPASVVATLSSSTTFYLHNSPTPPSADTSTPINYLGLGIDNLPMAADPQPPATAALYNYDANVDTLPGRRLRLNNGACCPGNNRWCHDIAYTDEPAERMLWRTGNLGAAVDLSAEMTFDWWWAFTGDIGNPSNDKFTWIVCDYDPGVAVGQHNPESVSAEQTGGLQGTLDICAPGPRRGIRAQANTAKNSRTRLLSYQIYGAFTCP